MSAANSRETPVSGRSTPSSGAVGKRELLHWVGHVTLRPCSRLEDLRDGTLLVSLFEKIFPVVFSKYAGKVKIPARTESDSKVNWDVLKSLMIDLRLPLQVYDKAGLQASRFRPCYNFLVMLFFLHNLSKNDDFSVDFEHAIEGKLAAFLQSTASIECLARGGAIDLTLLSKTDKKSIRDSDKPSPPKLSEARPPIQKRVSPPAAKRAPSPANGIAARRKTPTPTPGFLADNGSGRDSRMSQATSTYTSNGGGSRAATPLSDAGLDMVERDVIASEGEIRGGTISLPERHANSGKVTSAVQTDMTHRRLEKFLIRSMKAHRENEELKKRFSKDSTDVQGTGGEMAWQTSGGKVKGELLLNKLKLENEGLKRELETVRQAKEYAREKAECEMSDIARRHQREMEMLKEEHLTSLKLAGLTAANDVNTYRDDYMASLRRIREEVTLEADRVRQGGLASLSEEELEEELLMLRQYRITSEKENKALVKTNQELSVACEKLKENLYQHQIVIERLFDYQRAENKELEMTCDVASEETVMRDRQRERELLRLNRKLRVELEEKSAAFHAESLKLRQQLSELQYAAEHTDATLQAFEGEQELVRLRDELERLRRTNEYMRTRNSVFVVMNERSGDISGETEWRDGHAEESDGNLWLPSDDVTRNGRSADDINAEALRVVRESLGQDSKAEKLLWEMKANEAILRQRIIRSRDVLRTQRDNFMKSQRQMAQDLEKVTQELSEVGARSRLDLEELRETASKEKAVLMVKLQLAEASKEEIRSELEELSDESRQLEARHRDSETQVHSKLRNRLKEARAECHRLLLRENIWSQLLESERELGKVIEAATQRPTVDEMKALDQRRGELQQQCNAYLEQLGALAIMMETKSADDDKNSDEESLKEKALEAEVRRVNSSYEKLQDENLTLKKVTDDLLVRVKEIESDLDAQGRQKALLQKQIERLNAEKDSALEKVRQMHAEDNQTISSLRKELLCLHARVEEDMIEREFQKTTSRKDDGREELRGSILADRPATADTATNAKAHLSWEGVSKNASSSTVASRPSERDWKAASFITNEERSLIYGEPSTASLMSTAIADENTGPAPQHDRPASAPVSQGMHAGAYSRQMLPEYSATMQAIADMQAMWNPKGRQRKRLR